MRKSLPHSCIKDRRHMHTYNQHPPGAHKKEGNQQLFIKKFFFEREKRRKFFVWVESRVGEENPTDNRLQFWMATLPFLRW